VNLVQATVAEASPGSLVLDCPDLGGRIQAEDAGGGQPAPGDSRWVALRPEKIVISKEPPAGEGRTVLRGTVHDLGYFGNLSVYRVELPSGRMLQVSGQNRERTARKTVEWDDEVFVYWDNRSAIVLQD
jgi:putrescine transport system ATP-binding protein